MWGSDITLNEQADTLNDVSRKLCRRQHWSIGDRKRLGGTLVGSLRMYVGRP